MRNSRQFLISAFSAAVLVVSFAFSARADSVIAGNLGPGESYLETSGTTVLGSAGVFGSRSDAVPFTPTQSLNLSQILIALTSNGAVDNATVELVVDSGGEPGSTVLESWSLSGLPSLFSVSAITAAQTLTSTPGILLSAGTQYWIVAEPATSDTSDFWNINDTVDATMWDRNSRGTGWVPIAGNLVPAFEVTGSQSTPEPEPGSILLLGAGLIIVALAAKHSS